MYLTCTAPVFMIVQLTQVEVFGHVMLNFGSVLYDPSCQITLRLL